MKTKIITGVLLSLFAAILLWLDAAWLWVLLATICALVGYYEAIKICEAACARSGFVPPANGEAPAFLPHSSACVFGAALILICGVYLLFSDAAPLSSALIATLICASAAALFARDFAATFAMLYAFCGLFCLLDIYYFEGRAYLLWLIICVCACDSAAYFVGKAIGRTKFSASSPNKTAEGVAGGLVAAAILGALWAHFVLQMPWMRALSASLLLGVFGVAGDLFESRLKRVAGVKDSGSFLPGHGGVLDRFDALIFAAIFAKIAL